MPLLEGCQNLFEIERRLHAQLSHITLLGQIPLDDSDTQLLREKIKDELASDFERVEQCGKLSFACFLVRFGIEHYDDGTYWTRVQNFLGQAGPAKQHQWGETFLGTLERYKLTIFPNSVGLKKYVTPILLHGGIPDSDLPSFFGNVLYPVVNGNLDIEVSHPEQLVAECRELYQNTDMPVRRFLEYGGKPAADFLSRCLEMMRAAYSREPLPSAQELGLPERIVRRFEQWWQGFQQPTLLEQRIRLSRPRIERDAWGEVRCVLPEQIIANASHPCIRLQVTADGQDVDAAEVPFYRTSRGLVTERMECLLPPANKYQIQLLKDAQPLGDWFFAGLNDEGWMAFDEHGRLIRGRLLPRGLFWLVFAKEVVFDRLEQVREKVLGAGRWDRFHHLLVDTTEAESLTLSKTNGDTIKLLLAGTRAAVLCGDTLSGCDVAGASVYTGELPTLKVPLADDSELGCWDVIVEDLTGQALTRKRLALSEAAADIDQGCAVVPLAQAALLGEPLLGIYRVKVRSHGALGSDQQFQFAFVKDVAYKLDQPFYFSKESSRLTMFTLPSLRVRPEEEAAELIEQDEQDKLDGRWGVIFNSTDRHLTLNLEENESRKLALTFSIPRLQWAVRGLMNAPLRWHSTPEEIQLEDLESANEVTLLVQLPVEGRIDCTFELEGANQMSTETMRDGEVRFSLSQFSDSLRSLSQSIARFSVSVPDPLSGTQKVYLLLVRTRWAVERFEHQDIRTVVFSWEDNGRYRNRRLRLWNLSQPWNRPKEYLVEDGVSRIEISETFFSLPAGKYRVELLMESQFEVATPALPPRANKADVFDVTLGEAELVVTSLSMFRRCLARWLAGNEDGFILNDYTLAEADFEDLLWALRFLVREERASEARRLWFHGLQDQIKQAAVRNRLREQIRQQAQDEDSEKKELLTVCKTLDLAVNSLLTFQAGDNVRFDGTPAKFSGVSKWGTPGNPLNGGDPADLICLEYANGTKQWKPLSDIDRLKPVN